MSQHLVSNPRKVRYAPSMLVASDIPDRYEQTVYLHFDFANALYKKKLQT